MEHKIKYIQLNNGMEVISKVNFKNWEYDNYIKLYDPLRIYSIPPFLNPDEGENQQTLVLIKWVPWTDDISINISINKILIVTDISPHMENYYKTTLQNYTDAEINKELDETETFPTKSIEIFGNLDEDIQEIILKSTPEELEGLTEGVTKLLNKLTKKPKRTLH